MDLSPLAKNLKADFDAVDDKTLVLVDEATVSVSAAAENPALEGSVEAVGNSQGSDDLFNAEPQEFLTRESQFADRKHEVDQDLENEWDSPEKTKPKAKAKAGPKAKGKAKAKAKAASKSEASPAKPKPRGRPRKRPAAHARTESKTEKAELDDPEAEHPESTADVEAEHSEAKHEEEQSDENLVHEDNEAMDDIKEPTKAKGGKKALFPKEFVDGLRASAKTRADKKKEAPKQIFARRYRPGFHTFIV